MTTNINRARAGLVRAPQTVGEGAEADGGAASTGLATPGEETSGARRVPTAQRNAARAGMMASSAQIQAQVQGAAPRIEYDLEALMYGDEVTSNWAEFLNKVQGQLKELGYGRVDPTTEEGKAAIAQIKDYAGFSPNGIMDLDFLLALLMIQAEQDAYQSNRARYGGGPRNHTTGSGGGGGAGGGIGSRRTAPVDTANWQPGSGDVTPAQLQAIGRQSGHNLSAERAAEVAPHLNRAMAEANIDTPRKKAAFIAQLMHESGGFRYNEEIASGAAYEGRRDLGNIYPGDGRRFKGRGYIQLTGRANYEAAGRALGLDLVNNPELAAAPENAARVAAWFWNSRGLNGLAERGNFDGITRRINGGTNGAADRNRIYQAALGVLANNHGLPSTGQFLEGGDAVPGSAAAGASGPVNADTANMTEEQKFQHYSQIIEANGGTVNDAPGQRNILGLRSEDHNVNRYDDRMVVLWRDEQGQPHVREFNANMESITRYQGRYGNDVNGDGRRDLATLSAGSYTYSKGTSSNFGNVLRPAQTTAVMRDTDGDGRGDALDRTGAGRSILFHAGGRNDTGSAGCQTMDPATFRQFWLALGSDSSFQYTVVDT